MNRSLTGDAVSRGATAAASRSPEEGLFTTPRRVSIRTALLLMAGALMLPLLAMLGYILYSNAQNAESLARARMLDAAYTRAQAIEIELEGMRELLRLIAQRPLVRALDPSHCDPLLEELRAIDSRVANIGLRAHTGEAMCVQRSEGVSSTAQIRDVEWFREAIAVEGFKASNAFVAKTLGYWVVALSHTVRDLSEADAAVLTAAMPVERFAEWITRGKPVEGAVAFLVDRTGTVMARSLDNRAWLGKRPLEAEVIDKALHGADETYRARGLEGVERFYGIATVPSAGWKVMVGIPTAAVAASVRRQVQESALIWGGLALAACALAFGIARSISGPISSLRESIHAAAEGDFDLRLTPRGPAEVAQLSEEFKHMAAARREVEADLKSALEQRTRQKGTLRSLTQRLVTLQEKERRDIARELHDRIGQNLSALSINLARLGAGRSSAEESGARLAECASLVEATGLAVQDVLTELKPPMLANYGLLDALRFHAREFSRRTGIAVEVGGAEAAERPQPEAEMALFRVAQAALSNVARHARAKNVRIALKCAEGRIRLEIGDDGVGFDPERALASGRWGLTAMHERAEAIGGRLRVDSSPGSGARIIVEAGGA